MNLEALQQFFDEALGGSEAITGTESSSFRSYTSRCRTAEGDGRVGSSAVPRVATSDCIRADGSADALGSV